MMSAILILVFVAFPLSLAVGYAVYYLFSVPLRREERSALFLDLLQTAFDEGRDPAEVIRSAARTRDPVLSVRLHLLAAHLDRGMSLGEALDAVPELLSKRTNALLKAGLGQISLAGTLAVCRRSLRDACTEVWQAQTHTLVVFVTASPIALFVLSVLRIKVLPMLRMLAADMEVPAAGGPFGSMESVQTTWMIATICLLAVLYFLAALYVLGPHVRQWLDRLVPGVYDWCEIRVPWSRQRLQRDFCGTFGDLLDLGMPEEQALSRAASSTANSAFQARVDRVVKELRQGIALSEAVRQLDNTGEFRWRLANAVRGGRGFAHALAGWQEALDARAFQQHQSVLQLGGALLVVWNGVMVALVSWSLFYFLTSLIQQGVLW